MPQEIISTQIEQLRQEIDISVDKGHVIPFQIEEALQHLQEAEIVLASKDEDAWYPLTKAKIALHEGSSVSISELADANQSVIRKEIYKVWHELNDVQRRSPSVNTTNAADWLCAAETEMDLSDTYDKSQIMYCIMRARYSLAKAEEFVKWSRFGYLAISVECLYLLVLPIAFYFWAQQLGVTLQTLLMTSMLQVPFTYLYGASQAVCLGGCIVPPIGPKDANLIVIT